MTRRSKYAVNWLRLLCLFAIFAKAEGFSSLQANGGLKPSLSSSRSFEKNIYERSHIHNKITSIRMGAEASFSNLSLRTKVTSFTRKNSFLLGMAVAVSLAKAFPSVSL